MERKKAIQPGVLKAVSAWLLPDEAYVDVAALLKHFGDPTRVKLLHALEQNEMCVSDLASLLGITKSAVSHQLTALKLSKLVKARRDGQVVYYRLDDDHVWQILELAFEHMKEGTRA